MPRPPRLRLRGAERDDARRPDQADDRRRRAHDGPGGGRVSRRAAVGRDRTGTDPIGSGRRRPTTRPEELYALGALPWSVGSVEAALPDGGLAARHTHLGNGKPPTSPACWSTCTTSTRGTSATRTCSEPSRPGRQDPHRDDGRRAYARFGRRHRMTTRIAAIEDVAHAAHVG